MGQMHQRGEGVGQMGGLVLIQALVATFFVSLLL